MLKELDVLVYFFTYCTEQGWIFYAFGIFINTVLLKILFSYDLYYFFMAFLDPLWWNAWRGTRKQEFGNKKDRTVLEGNSRIE